MQLGEQKKALRREIKTRAAVLSEEDRKNADRSMFAWITGWTLWRRAESVFAYVSMWREPDTRALIDAALKAGKRVYVPRCYGEGVMKALRISSLDELTPGLMDSPEPPESAEEAPEQIDLALIPCVAAGLDGARLGHGAGYYDRFLAGHETVTVCLCHADLLTEGIPMGEFDRRMDYVITENGIKKIGG